MWFVSLWGTAKRGMDVKARVVTLALALACGLGLGCASRTRPMTMPNHRLEAPVPERAPEVEATVPRLIPYPGLDVAYVANAEGEVYAYRGVYYTYFDGNWFYAQRLTGPWKFIEMKYVPSDLFRVRGHRPYGR